MIRQFRLYNSNKDELNLLDKNYFASNPEGLGTSISFTRAASDGYFRTIDASSNMTQIKFTMLFGAGSQSNGYYYFNEFTKFMSFTPIKIRYTTDVFDYYADVDLASMSKSEMNEYSIVPADIALDRTTPWYNDKEVLIGARAWPEGIGKIYHSKDNTSYGYNYPYIYGANLNIPTFPVQEFTIPTAYSDPSAVGFGTLIRFTSKVDGYQNPTVKLTSTLSGQTIVQKDRYLVTLNAGEYIEVSSFPNFYFARKYDANGNFIENIYEYQDRLDANFIKVMPGKNYIEVVPVSLDASLSMRYREEAVIA